jgi:hypothetical protein
MATSRYQVELLSEARDHIERAEKLLDHLEAASGTEIRRMRARMYLLAMQRLHKMIECHFATLDAQCHVAAQNVEIAARPNIISSMRKILFDVVTSMKPREHEIHIDR